MVAAQPHHHRSNMESDLRAPYFAVPAPKPEAFRPPVQTGDDGYYGILWHAFYKADGISIEASIIDKELALSMAQALSRCHRTEVKAELWRLQCWVDFGRLRHMFCWWVDMSSMNKDTYTYRAVKQCREEAVMLGKVLLEDYDFHLTGDMAGDPTITRLRTDLFLDLCIGKELVLLDDKNPQMARSRLVWWTRIDDESAILTIRGAAEATPSQEKSLTVYITGDIVSKLGSQGIFLPSTTLNSMVVVRQSTEDATAKSPSKPAKTSKCRSVVGGATSSNGGEC